MATAKPPFTMETAKAKVKAAQNLWNTREPSAVTKAYTPTSIWRNRDAFFSGHDAIHAFLTAKWEREVDYKLRKELFCFSDNKIAVQFWYEWRDSKDGMQWKRTYGLEDWTFNSEGKMEKRMMSANDMVITDEQRWFKEGTDVDEVQIGGEHW